MACAGGCPFSIYMKGYPMDIPARKQIRLAEMIQQRLRTHHSQRFAEVIRRTCTLLDNVAGLRRTTDLLAICIGRGWNAAADKTTERIRQGLRDLPYYASEVERFIEACKTPVPPVKDIVAELQQADQEFDQLRYIEESDLLAITVGPIELEDIFLGEFEIQLHLPSLSEVRRPHAIYRIVALDPHPPACNDSVTHPHVSDEHLCEGDAGAAIHAALTNGRICDFFQLVTAVLTTYNSGSPYVALSDWDGRPCYDCGYTMASDDSYWCSSCENDFCSECISCCSRCDESTCRGCLEECTVCGELVCPSCKTTCPDCGRMLCRTCLEESQCPCIEERQENEENENDSEHQEPCTVAGEASESLTGNSGQEQDLAASQAGVEAA